VGTDDEEKAINWMSGLYRSKMLTPDKDAFFCHAVSAVDSAAVSDLFGDARLIVLMRAVGGVAA